MKRYVLDASAMLAFLEDGPGANVIEELLGRAIEKQQRLLMPVTSWGELYRSIGLRHGAPAARDRMEQVGKLPLEVVAVDADTVELAAVLSCRYQVDYFQCLPAAVAQMRKATLVSCDTDLGMSRDVEGLRPERVKKCTE